MRRIWPWKPLSLKKEVKDATFSSYAEGTLGPDGLSFIFYQKFWDIVKSDFCTMIHAFQEGDLDLFRLNFSCLTLIPKVEDAMEMRNFMPISLLNCSSNFFSKLLPTRLENVCQRLVAKEQIASIRVRYILERVVIAHA
jgi:hypothetical protein